MKHLSILLVVFVFTKTTVSWHGKVKSFGRDAVLGQLYDARTDTFFSQSIAKEGMPDDLPDIRHLIQSPWTSVGNWEKAPRFPGESSIFSYGELERIELLADYVEAKGSTGFFKEGRLDPHASIIVHPFESRTDYEKIYFSIFEPYLNREPLETNVDATHVVAGIWRGRDSLVLLEDINGKRIDTDYAFGLLEDSTEPNARDLNVTVKIFTDIPPPTEAGYPKTATELRGKYPDIFQHIINYNDERGVKKLYVMAEIGLLRTYFNVTGIETPEFDDTVRFGNINIWPMSVFEKISEFEIKLREIRNRLLKIPSFRQTVLTPESV